MKSYSVLMLVYVAITMSASPISSHMSCTTSYECPDTTPCCLDDTGRLVGNSNLGPALQMISWMSTTGHCSSVLERKWGDCNTKCGCPAGYECYSPMAGIELPMKCYNSQWVKEQKEYWANCSPPDCYFPA